MVSIKFSGFYIFSESHQPTRETFLGDCQSRPRQRFLPSLFNARSLGCILGCSCPIPFKAALDVCQNSSIEHTQVTQGVKGLSSKIIRVLPQKRGLIFDNSFSFCKNHPPGLTAWAKVFTLPLSTPGGFRVLITELQLLSFDFRAKRSSLLLVAGSPNRPSGFRRPEGLLLAAKIEPVDSGHQGRVHFKSRNAHEDRPPLLRGAEK
ncbi:MAG: hypothetical protein CJBNEKGG_00855 [Prosthecobacter sp.]|nr:hypothetical protein [Prosthecobacter sp.]